MPKGLVPQEGLEYLRKLRDVKYYETIFEVLARQYELAKLDEAREGALIQVVDPAVIPDKRSFPKRIYIVLGSFFGGLIIAILAAFAMASLERMEAIRNPRPSCTASMAASTSGRGGTSVTAYSFRTATPLSAVVLNFGLKAANWIVAHLLPAGIANGRNNAESH